MNQALWLGQTSAPTPNSVVRMRWFWRQFYRLEQQRDVNALRETHQFEFYVPSSDGGRGRLLRVTSAPDETLLFLAGPGTSGYAEIGRVDEVNTEPHTLRWSEVGRLAAYLVDRGQSPVDPSIALLMLSVFVGAVEEDFQNLKKTLSAELRQLDLLDEAEISEAIEYRSVSKYGIADYERIWWAADPVVGWRLEGVPKQSRHAGWRPGYSQRDPQDEYFPAADFVALLRAVGVDDV